MPQRRTYAGERQLPHAPGPQDHRIPSRRPQKQAACVLADGTKEWRLRLLVEKCRRRKALVANVDDELSSSSLYFGHGAILEESLFFSCIAYCCTSLIRSHRNLFHIDDRFVLYSFCWLSISHSLQSSNFKYVYTLVQTDPHMNYLYRLIQRKSPTSLSTSNFNAIKRTALSWAFMQIGDLRKVIPILILWILCASNHSTNGCRCKSDAPTTVKTKV